MKNIVTRMKTLVLDNNGSGQTLSYVKGVEVVHPEILMTKFSRSSMPFIAIVPINTKESWVASQKKQALHVVKAYLFLSYHQRELSIIGDSTRPQGQGIIDFVNDFDSVFRAHRLAIAGINYLDKPLEIMNVNYIVNKLGEDAFMLVAEISMSCSKLFIESNLPGNI